MRPCNGRRRKRETERERASASEKDSGRVVAATAAVPRRQVLAVMAAHRAQLAGTPVCERASERER